MGYIIRRFRLVDMGKISLRKMCFRKMLLRVMCLRKNGQRKKGLRKMRRRAVKSWKARCPSIRRRRRCVRGALFLLAAGTMAWAGTGRGIVRWVREQIPHMVRIEESSPARAADRDGMTSVKRGFTIRLDEREIHIYQVEEGYEDRERSGDSGSD